MVTAHEERQVVNRKRFLPTLFSFPAWKTWCVCSQSKSGVSW